MSVRSPNNGQYTYRLNCHWVKLLFFTSQEKSTQRYDRRTDKKGQKVHLGF